MDKCPYCGAETRPGDNFCLNCGNRLLPATPSPSQPEPPAAGDATLAVPEDWAAVQGTPSPGSWSEISGATIANTGSEMPAFRESSSATAQATMDRIQHPAHLILRADNGEVLQEYTLDKPEITIGRAPSSDILLSKDKLTSRRHAIVQHENGQYLLRDERSANGTFVNGQQIEEMTPYVLNNGDHIGIGEHELIFREFGASAEGVEDLPTVAVQYDPEADLTYRTRDDALATVQANDEFGTHAIDEAPVQDAQFHQTIPTPEQDPGAYVPVPTPSTPVASAEKFTSVSGSEPPAMEITPPPPPTVADYHDVRTPANQASSDQSDSPLSFNKLTSLPQPSLPDLSALMAALSSLDGQVMSLQEQFNTTQEAVRNHESDVIQTANQLRTGIRRVSERMDNTIADVARSREALAWAELSQLMEDVMNNPRDIEYVTKLARKARELNKVFQIHQNVLNTMAECNSLLRSMIGEEK